MSITIIVHHINDALACGGSLERTPLALGGCRWLVTIGKDYEFLANMLVEAGRAEIISV